jgi:hypothetical protein
LIHTGRPSRTVPLIAIAGVLTLALLVFLGVRGRFAFDQQRHLDAARAVLRAPDAVTRILPPTAAGRAQGISGALRFRPRGRLSVLTFHGLPPTVGQERYLVFLQNYGGWLLAGAARPDAHGDAEVRFAAEPRPITIYEVVVTRDVDDATSLPHGAPLLHWFGTRVAPRGAVPFDSDGQPEGSLQPRVGAPAGRP